MLEITYAIFFSLVNLRRKQLLEATRCRFQEGEGKVYKMPTINFINNNRAPDQSNSDLRTYYLQFCYHYRPCKSHFSYRWDKFRREKVIVLVFSQRDRLTHCSPFSCNSRTCSISIVTTGFVKKDRDRKKQKRRN